MFAYGNNVFVGTSVRGKSWTFLCLRPCQWLVFLCVLQETAAKFISVVLLLFCPLAIVFGSGRCLTSEVRVSR